MKYNLAFKYRIYPNKEQELLINKTFGCVRFVYNTILYIANKIYEETGKNKIVTPASLKSENQFLKEVDSLALSNAQLNVRRSFTNFFQKRAKFPRFKSKKNNVKSYTTNCVNNSIRIEENNYLVLPKLKRIKLKYHREIPKNYKIKSVTLTISNGSYYVSILGMFFFLILVALCLLTGNKEILIDILKIFVGFLGGTGFGFYIRSKRNE